MNTQSPLISNVMKSSLAVFRKRLKTLSKPIIFQIVLESMEISITVQNIEPSNTLPKKLKDIANKVEHSASSFKPSIPFHSLYNMVDEYYTLEKIRTQTLFKKFFHILQTVYPDKSKSQF